MFELRKAELSSAYRRKWKERTETFFNLYKDGVKVSSTLYRKGMSCGHFKDPYFMLIKYTEDYYPDNIVKNKDDKRHLKGQWCILGQDGKERVVFDQFKIPYIMGGLLYSIDNEIYNAETGYHYGKSYRTIESKIYLFFEKKYEKSEPEKTVIMINKITGEWEFIK